MKLKMPINEVFFNAGGLLNVVKHVTVLATVSSRRLNAKPYVEVFN